MNYRRNFQWLDHNILVDYAISFLPNYPHSVYNQATSGLSLFLQEAGNLFPLNQELMSFLSVGETEMTACPAKNIPIEVQMSEVVVTA